MNNDNSHLPISNEKEAQEFVDLWSQGDEKTLDTTSGMTYKLKRLDPHKFELSSDKATFSYDSNEIVGMLKGGSWKVRKDTVVSYESPWITQEMSWKLEGKCPKCGQLGKYINMGATCTEHGLY